MEFIKRVIFGFATGLGFAIALLLIYVMSIDLIVDGMYEQAIETKEENMDWSYSSSNNTLLISDEESQIDSEGIVVTGVLTNNDEHGWSSIKIELELFDNKGGFVHECTEYISQKIEPGQSENFKVSCKGCKKAKLPEFSTYKLRVVSASNF